VYVEKSQQAKTTMWIPRQVTASTPGEAAESIPGGKPASAPSTWRIISATARAPER